jgi:3-hydroxybutyrate dehydrogenase
MTMMHEDDVWVLPEEVAEVMLSLIEDPAYEGGTILEVGKNCVRRVGILNDPGPTGTGLSVTNMHQAADVVYSRLKDGTFSGTDI